MNNDNSNFRKWDVDLSDREAFLIGKIVAQWGALEHEVFLQTLLTFDTHEGQAAPLPRTMNNLQFTEVLMEWKARVVDGAGGDRGKVLQQQYDEIAKLKDYRNALVHGMWEWSSSDLHRITTVRVRKKKVARTHFSADDLENFFFRVAGINFKIRFPGGLDDLADALSKGGGQVSRRFLASISGSPVASDWLSTGGNEGDQSRK